MKRIAFSLWNERIAPVFDVARTIWIVDSAAGQVIGQTGRRFSSDDPHERAMRLATLQVDQLVCGAITRSTHDALTDRGIEVVSFVSGDLPHVMRTWVSNHFNDKNPQLPGCRKGIRIQHRGGSRAGGNDGENRSTGTRPPTSKVINRDEELLTLITDSSVSSLIP